MVNLKQKDAYIHEVAKILYRAKNPIRYWALEHENGKLTNKDSDTKEILNILGLFTPEEFMNLVKGNDTLTISDLPRVNPYEIQEEQDGIYIEKCTELDSMTYGRKYSVVSGDKKLCIGLNTKNDKTMSFSMIERQEEGIYIYSTGTNEIRLITNEQLEEICDNWRGLLMEAKDVHTNEEIITCLTHSSRISSLSKDGVLIANQVFNKEQLDETRINQLFNTGIKNYVEMYSPRIVGAYETELSAVESWTR